jgi:hypothetical protein
LSTTLVFYFVIPPSVSPTGVDSIASFEHGVVGSHFKLPHCRIFGSVVYWWFDVSSPISVPLCELIWLIALGK